MYMYVFLVNGPSGSELCAGPDNFIWIGLCQSTQPYILYVSWHYNDFCMFFYGITWVGPLGSMINMFMYKLSFLNVYVQAIKNY